MPQSQKVTNNRGDNGMRKLAKILSLLFTFFLICCTSKTLLGDPTGRQPSLAANPGVFELVNPKDFKQVIAISDVHGMYDKLVDLLKNAKLINASNDWIGGKTLVIVIGDSIDKGDQTIPVVDLWIHLIATAPASG